MAIPQLPDIHREGHRPGDPRTVSCTHLSENGSRTDTVWALIGTVAKQEKLSTAEKLAWRTLAAGGLTAISEILGMGSCHDLAAGLMVQFFGFSLWTLLDRERTPAGLR